MLDEINTQDSTSFTLSCQQTLIYGAVSSTKTSILFQVYSLIAIECTSGSSELPHRTALCSSRKLLMFEAFTLGRRE